MSNDTKNNNNTMKDVLKMSVIADPMDVLLKKGEIAKNIFNDPSASLEQKSQACKSVANATAEFSSASFLANKRDCPEDSPSSISCSSGPVDWSKVMHSVGNKSAYIANKT